MLTDSSDFHLDTVLTEVGAFGLFQIVSYALIFIPCTLSAAYQVNYMFSTNIIDYRWVEKAFLEKENDKIRFIGAQ